ncbi:MAG: hypothetical protein NVV82_04385 [Sporocytophaga sp.]|nr:hypothetical protein [Sporocytophaga sp.]
MNLKQSTSRGMSVPKKTKTDTKEHKNAFGDFIVVSYQGHLKCFGVLTGE